MYDVSVGIAATLDAETADTADAEKADAEEADADAREALKVETKGQLLAVGWIL